MYIFNHIPKCGGLSYRALLEELFGLEQVTHISINLEEEYHANPDEFRQYTMLMGHFGVRWNEALAPGRRWLTALREPVDRVVSTYYYWRHNAPRSPDMPWLHMAQTMSLEDFVASGHYLVLQGISDAQTWQLADDLRWRYHTVPEQDALAVAKANLDRFDFIGIYEEFAPSIARMCGYLGFAPPPQAPHVNATRKRRTVEELNPVIVESILELNRMDVELYKYALETVQHACAACHSRPQDTALPYQIRAGCEPLRMTPVPADLAQALQVSIVSIPAACACSDVLEAVVEVFNGGLNLWSSAPPNPLLLSYRWLTDTREPCILDGWRSDLRPPLEGCSTQRYRMHIMAPETPGRYTLRVTLVQELVQWFDEPPLYCAEEVEITVRSSRSVEAGV